MSDSLRHALRVAGLAAALGLTTLAGPAVAGADDGTKSPTPGDSKVSKTPYDATGGAPAMPATSSLSQISSGMGDISGASPYGASQQQAEAEEAEAMAEMLSAQQDNETEFETEMQDFAAQVNALMGSIVENAPTQRPTTRG
ncbi:exported hypothetical protein [uncultured Mycobacterium sp.]|uniref:Uncharacterized protein n=1 Tax=uncultured Mycobacterium sp. TaxID=171292 RepID=A0A1Y5PP41_9MYCO|nr:exported hypothetical protein [uncultured Mycobacterium sp.]